MNDSNGPARGARPLLLYVCFFLSGIAGLIYEVVWSRYLALFLGSTGQAHVIILSTYMGGLALGAWVFGRKADHVRRPLMLYVVLETGIGLLGLVYPLLFSPVRQVFLSLVGMLGLGPISLHLAAATACVLTLLVPTTLMGGTLPVLARHLIREERMIGRGIARLYYLNSLGAVAGSLLAGFWLVRSVGLDFSMTVAATLNLGVAFVLWISLRSPGKSGEEAKIITDIEQPSNLIAASSLSEASSRRRREARIAMAVIAISGFASMVYEVAWIRLLTLVLGSSSFSFALMLAAFISGITLGSFLLSLRKSDGGHYAILGWSEILIGATALLSMLFYVRLPVVLNHWRTGLVPEEYNFPLFQFVQFLLCFLVMFAPTVFMGIALPAASRVVAEGTRGIGRKIGDVFSINTVGTLLGASAAGFVLMPSIGLSRTIELAVAINLILGFWVLLTGDAAQSRGRPGARWAAVGTGCVLASFLFLAPSWDPRLFSAATYRSRTRIENFSEFKETLKTRSLLYYKDGADASIAVSSDPDPRIGQVLALLINGKPDASNEADMITQLMVGHLPMLLHPDPNNVLVVGLGAGVSAGATTLYDAEKIECVELIPEVIEAARYFKEYNRGIVDNPKARIIVQDAKTFLQISPTSYDVIVNQPTNLWISGVAGLFTREYFAACRAKLRPGGLFAIWIQCYEILDPTVFSILNTFDEVFPFSSLFDLTGYDVLLVGSTQPFEADFARMEARLAQPEIAADLSAFGVGGLLPVLAMQMKAKNRTAGPYIAMGGINSDFFPSLEYEASRGFFAGSTAAGLKAIDDRSRAPGRAKLWIADYEPARKPDESVFIEYFNLLALRDSLFDRAQSAWCDVWERYYPDSAKARLARGKIRGENAHWRLGVLSDDRLATSTDVQIMKSDLLWEAYDRARSYARLPEANALRSVLQSLAAGRGAPRATALAGLGDLELDARRPEPALGRYAEALEALGSGKSSPAPQPSAGEIHLKIAEAHLDLGRLDQARLALAKTSEHELDARGVLQRQLIYCRLLQEESTSEKAPDQTAK